MWLDALTITRVLLNLGFSPERADACAQIFTQNSCDGVYSHGLNRFPVFIGDIKKGYIDIHASPKLVKSMGVIEQWDGQLGLGVLNAQFCMQRAIELAKQNGMGCVALKNTNHWMRGGTYGWQAADAGCIGINFTNTIGIMPPWGGKSPAIGNNPLIIAVPRKEGHIVLDMAMSQFSYGKMQEAELKNQELPYFGGYDNADQLTRDPKIIQQNKRSLPIGFWKGSGLAMMLDLLATLLSGGKSTGAITQTGEEKGVSQVYICFDLETYENSEALINQILTFTNSADKINDAEITYPGERTLQTRKYNLANGIPVDEKMWAVLLSL
ncbi:MAG: 3-dehydro-L-gulonate 2-dehydrogenase [Bacteroidetes bacterium]|nr:3-dehydro-L-gulonate 2-dehydrogenase [Bacteroidota bacterium]